MNRITPLPVLLLVITSGAIAEGVVLPGLGDSDERRWQSVDDQMGLSAYEAATRNNVKVMGSSIGEYLKITGVPEGVLGATGSAVRLFSGEEIKLFSSQGLSINTRGGGEEDGGAYLNYSVDW